MSEAITFDTHRFVKRLTDCGFTERQAETLAEEHVALLNGNLATKADVAKVQADVAKVQADIAKVQAALKTDIALVQADVAKVQAALKTDIALVQADVAKVEAALKTDISTVKADLLKWMIGALIAQGGLIVTLIKVL